MTTPRRLYFGASLFAVGTALVVASIAVATTDIGAQFGLGLIEARRTAGTLAGLGLPLSFLGVFALLPSGPTARAASVIGTSVSVLGVVLFHVAYPSQWFAAGDPLAVVTVLVYFFGALTTLSCLFAGLATFKTRNDPGGTARMEFTEEGGVRLVETVRESPDSVPGFGSVGLFGSDPDGEVATQTNRASGELDEDRDDAEILSGGPAATGPASAAADGGSAAVSEDSSGGEFTDAEFVESATQRGRPDAYCGNCEHFEYVKVDGELAPYCGLHDDLMDDMDACAEWTESN